MKPNDTRTLPNDTSALIVSIENVAFVRIQKIILNSIIRNLLIWNLVSLTSRHAISIPVNVRKKINVLDKRKQVMSAHEVSFMEVLMNLQKALDNQIFKSTLDNAAILLYC